MMRVARGCWQDYCEEAKSGCKSPRFKEIPDYGNNSWISNLDSLTHPSARTSAALDPPLGPLQSGVRTTSGLSAQPALGPRLWPVLTLLFVRTPAKKPSP